MTNFEKVVKEVRMYRDRYGYDVCTDVRLTNNGKVARYVFMPNNQSGYIQEYDLKTMKERHCGLTAGCFWTDWR